MIGYLPELYPDELVYSWLSRIFVHTGYVSHQALRKELFCKRSDNPSKEFLGHLNSDAIQVIQEMIPLQKLILDHTMFPQYARFLPLSQRKDALHRMEHDYGDPHYLFTILPRDEADTYLKYCPCCAQEDRAAFGETYWHRKHQLRGAAMCYKHGCVLENSTVPAKSEQGFILCSAEEYCIVDTPRFIENPQLQQYMEFVSAVFDAPMDFETDISISAVLYCAMASTEYLKRTGNSRYTQKFADDLAQYYNCMGLAGVISLNRIQKVLLTGGTEFSAVCQIAFFLGMTDDALTAPVLSHEQIAAEEASHYIRNRIPVDWKDYDAEIAAILAPLAKSIYTGTFRADGRPERVSERLIYRELNLQGHRLENMPKCRAIMQRYYESYEQHWARRLVWAYHRLKKERNGKPFYWVHLRRISGVKERNLAKTIPLIHNYADDETTDDLIRIVGQTTIHGAAVYHISDVSAAAGSR